MSVFFHALPIPFVRPGLHRIACYFSCFIRRNRVAFAGGSFCTLGLKRGNLERDRHRMNQADDVGMEKDSDWLGKATILLPLIAFAGMLISPILARSGTGWALALANCSLAVLFLSGPFAAWVIWQKRRKHRPNRRLAITGFVVSFALSLFMVGAMILISVKNDRARKALEERQRAEAQSPAVQ